MDKQGVCVHCVCIYVKTRQGKGLFSVEYLVLLVVLVFIWLVGWMGWLI
jgi:hypothetical protein